MHFNLFINNKVYRLSNTLYKDNLLTHCLIKYWVHRFLCLSFRYKENALKLRDIFLDRPMPPLEMGVYWIEYVLRHKGAAHLRSPALDLPLPQYLLLDVVALSIAITLMTIFILHTLFRYLCTRCIKWWPLEKNIVFEKKIFRKNVSLFLCLLWKYKVKANWPVSKD